MNITHPFAKEPALDMLFDGCKTMQEWVKRVEKFAPELIANNPFRYDKSADESDNINKIKGDAFEVFCELLSTSMGVHPDVGLVNYQSVPAVDDNGVDAYASNLAGELTAIQCKFSNDPKREYKADNGPNSFVAEAQKGRGEFDPISMEHKRYHRLVFMTTGAGIAEHTNEVKFEGGIRGMGIHQLKPLVNYNVIFWQTAVKCLQNYRNTL